MKASGALLLLVTASVFVGGSIIGFRLLTTSADTTVATPTCEVRAVAEGEGVAAAAALAQKRRPGVPCCRRRTGAPRRGGPRWESS